MSNKKLIETLKRERASAAELRWMDLAKSAVYALSALKTVEKAFKGTEDYYDALIEDAKKSESTAKTLASLAYDLWVDAVMDLQVASLKIGDPEAEEDSNDY